MTRMLKNFNIYLALFSIGALLYAVIEILFRGYTHWTMPILGGICFCMLYVIDGSESMTLPLKCLFGALFITVAEFICGCIVNIGFGWAVWDYSDRLLNVMGQICPLFSGLWFLLCIPGFMMTKIVRLRVNYLQSKGI